MVKFIYFFDPVKKKAHWERPCFALSTELQKLECTITDASKNHHFFFNRNLRILINSRDKFIPCVRGASGMRILITNEKIFVVFVTLVLTRLATRERHTIVWSAYTCVGSFLNIPSHQAPQHYYRKVLSLSWKNKKKQRYASNAPTGVRTGNRQSQQSMRCAVGYSTMYSRTRPTRPNIRLYSSTWAL